MSKVNGIESMAMSKIQYTSSARAGIKIIITIFKTIHQKHECVTAHFFFDTTRNMSYVVVRMLVLISCMARTSAQIDEIGGANNIIYGNTRFLDGIHTVYDHLQSLPHASDMYNYVVGHANRLIVDGQEIVYVPIVGRIDEFYNMIFGSSNTIPIQVKLGTGANFDDRM